MSSLFAEVEIPSDARAPVAGELLSPSERPNTVRLSGEASDAHVALVVAMLAVCVPSTTLAELAANFPIIAAGGLVAVEGEHEIHSSCCCGIETWREWEALLTTGASPWLGHDPDPGVTREDGVFFVWAGAPPNEGRPIRFERSELEAALASVRRDLEGFATRLREWSLSREPSAADPLAAAFRHLVHLDE